MTNKNNTALYTGVTNNLIRRVYEHKTRCAAGFTKRYKTEKLVYYEELADAYSAISREKQIKGGSRADKLRLIKGINPTFEDLYERIIQ